VTLRNSQRSDYVEEVLLQNRCHRTNFLLCCAPVCTEGENNGKVALFLLWRLRFIQNARHVYRWLGFLAGIRAHRIPRQKRLTNFLDWGAVGSVSTFGCAMTVEEISQQQLKWQCCNFSLCGLFLSPELICKCVILHGKYKTIGWNSTREDVPNDVVTFSWCFFTNNKVQKDSMCQSTVGADNTRQEDITHASARQKTDMDTHTRLDAHLFVICVWYSKRFLTRGLPTATPHRHYVIFAFAGSVWDIVSSLALVSHWWWKCTYVVGDSMVSWWDSRAIQAAWGREALPLAPCVCTGFNGLFSESQWRRS
jgi:hypothetical protein